MNQDNYCSPEVAQKLVDACIVLETDWYWVKLITKEEWVLSTLDNVVLKFYESIPAPSMAEVWRELPESITKGGTIQYLEMGKTGSKTYAAYDFADDYVLFDNPADVLAELLIWVKGQEEGK